MRHVMKVVCCMMCVAPAMVAGLLVAKSSALMQDNHKKIADGLITVRKEYPASQPKVYAMLDQLDKLYNAARTISQKKTIYKKKLLEKATEAAQLKQEVSVFKNESSSAKKSLESEKSDLINKLAQEQERVQQLQLERKELLNKVALFETQKKTDETTRDVRTTTKIAGKDLQKRDLEQAEKLLKEAA